MQLLNKDAGLFTKLLINYEKWLNENEEKVGNNDGWKR